VSAEPDLKPRDWDAAAYHRVSGVQEAWARDVLERLPLRGDEVVLDAGCGSGRVTRLLIERLPRGRVIGVDASPSMIEEAREIIRDRDQVIASDLLELDLTEQVDAVFSNAVFHWVEDHRRLFARLAAVMRPGARLVAQCGGEGNVAAFLRVTDSVLEEAPFAEHFRDWHRPWKFAGPKETSEGLRRAGFAQIRCWLSPSEVRPEEPLEFLRAVCLGPHLERLPEELHAPLVEAVAERCGEPLQLDYVRLNIGARKPA
jgi:trans-aconitate 2-methyltransferase